MIHHIVGTRRISLRRRRRGRARRLADPQSGYSEQQSGHARDEERRAPTPGLGDGAAQKIRGEQAQRQAHHEDAHSARALLSRIQVADERLAGGGATGLANADAHAREQVGPVTDCEPRACGQHTPERHADRDHTSTLPRVAEATERHAGHGVDEREGGVDPRRRCIVHAELDADRLEQRAGDLPVEEIHQVDAEQHRQRESRVFLLVRHGKPLIKNCGYGGGRTLACDHQRSPVLVR
jgi:hypothetical protein